MEFTVLQYNLFGRPYEVSHDGQNERLERIPQALLAIPDEELLVDVATFCEADNSEERDLMFAAFAAVGYKYRTDILEDPDNHHLINGGVIIGSKWPILREDQIIFDHCKGTDCLAAKGVKYARVEKTISNGTGNVSKIFNIFATHMQAWPSVGDIHIRELKPLSSRHLWIRSRFPRGSPSSSRATSTRTWSPARAKCPL